MPEPDGAGVGGELKSTAKKKLGPFEYWQIGAGLAGLLLAYLLLRRAKAGGAAGATAGTPLSTIPPSDLATTGANTALSGQLQDLQTSVGDLGAQIAALPKAVSAPTNTGGTSSASGTGSSLLSLAGQSSPSAADSAYWQTYLSGSGLNQTFLAIENTPGATTYAQSNPSGFVTAQYQQLLGRAPAASDISYWTGQLGPNPTQAQVLQESKAFAASAKGENPAA